MPGPGFEPTTYLCHVPEFIALTTTPVTRYENIKNVLKNEGVEGVKCQVELIGRCTRSSITSGPQILLETYP